MLLALLVGSAGVEYRLALLLADASPTISDEATMVLAALRIALGEDFPFWFYGHAYMYIRTFKGYLAAPIVLLFRPSVFALRLGPEPGAFDVVTVPGWRVYLPRR